jgi:hypothetical protein
VVLNVSQHIGWTRGATVKVFGPSSASEAAGVARNVSAMVVVASGNGMVRGRGLPSRSSRLWVCVRASSS